MPGHGLSAKPDQWEAYAPTELIADFDAIFERYKAKHLPPSPELASSPSPDAHVVILFIFLFFSI